MAKLILLLATFALFLLLTNASIYRIEIDEENPKQKQDCRQQFEDQHKLRSCRQFMEEECCSGRCSCSSPRSPRNTASELFDSCCDELKEMDKQCRCRNLKQMVEQHLIEESMSRRTKEKMYDSAEGMLSLCRVEPESCESGSRSVFA